MSIQKVRTYFEGFGIADRIREFEVSSATVELAAQAVGVEDARIAKTLSFLLKDGSCILIAAAGGAAHLGGVLAAATVLPVIGVPVAGGALNGLDALYATVQMPSGVPVATVAVGSAGPVNAALLAVQILGTADNELREKFRAHKQELREKVAAADERIHA